MSTTTQPGLRKRGFAGMDPERQREIASMGGRRAHQKGTGHEFTSDEARQASLVAHARRRERKAAKK